MIQPSIGRVLWFWPDGSTEGSQPLAALVTAVFGPTCVNLAIFAPNGVPLSHPPTSIPLLQDGDQPPKRTDGTFVRHARWMPYQIAQAARTERLQAQLAAASVQDPAAGG